MKMFAIILAVVLTTAAEGYLLLSSVPFSAVTFFTTDNFGNAYVVDKNELVLVSGSGTVVNRYSKNNFGALGYVDATDPLKILLFYPDFSRLVFLNSNLSEQATVDLREKGILETEIITMTNDGAIWLYDRQDDQLKKLDLNMQVLMTSNNITQQVGYGIRPEMLTEHEGNLYINNPESGILVFDRYGTYMKTIPVTEAVSMQLIGNEILLLKNDTLTSYNIRTVEEKRILLPDARSINNCRLERDQLYLLTTDTLSIYSF